TPHHRFLLQLHLEQVEALDRAIARIDQEIEAHLDSFREATQIVRTIPGFDDRSAQSVLSKIGIDMRRFPRTAALRTGIAPPPYRPRGPQASEIRRKRPRRSRRRASSRPRREAAWSAPPCASRSQRARGIRAWPPVVVEVERLRVELGGERSYPIGVDAEPP